MTNEKQESLLPIYVSFATFSTFLDWIKEMSVTPSRIDRSLWGPKFGGGTGGQLVVGLRFLRLLDGELPTEGLELLARADASERATLLGAMIRDAYGDDVIDNLDRFTPKMVNDALDRLGATESTRRKAFSFLVNAARFAEIPIAPQIAKQARNKPSRIARPGAKTSTPRRASTRQPPTTPLTGNGVKPPADKPLVNTRTLDLRSGGHVELTISVNFFDLDDEDRAFVFYLIDKMRKYATISTGSGIESDAITNA